MEKTSSNIKLYGCEARNGDNSLQLSPITLNEDYRKKWNIRLTDFVCLSRDGVLISNSLYRVGGMGKPDLKKDNYFLLLKHVERKDCNHLESYWCIIDKNGVERVEFKKSLDSPYLVKNSCIYSIDRKYYNIETGEFYSDASTSMESTHFLFLENRHDKDQSKRGVMKINKKDGTWELFS